MEVAYRGIIPDPDTTVFAPVLFLGDPIPNISCYLCETMVSLLCHFVELCIV
jgi:hypothetical protein